MKTKIRTFRRYKPKQTAMTTPEAMKLAAFETRGRILQLSIELENLFVIYISEVFTKDVDKIQDFVSLILSRVDFEYKRRAFLYLLEKHNNAFYKENQELSTKTKKLVEVRNVFAHWPVDFSNEANLRYEQDKTITYVLVQKKDKNLFTHEAYSQERVNDIIKDFQEVNHLIFKLVS